MPGTRRLASEPQETRARPPLSPVTVVGILLLAAGLAVLGWVGYQYLGTGVVARRSFDSETRSLRSGWSSPAAVPGAQRPDDPASPPSAATVPGSAIALLRVPRFGNGWEVPVVEGTDASDLAHGVGHYDGTAEPGAVGNFAIAGHRITHGQPFAKLLTLDPGDQVVVETRAAVFTYVLDSAPRDLTVPDTAGWVLDPVPHDAGARPSQALITLTTCQDLFHSPDRSVGFGHLVATQVK